MIGHTLSHYRIVAPLGSGGMGVVYEAEDTRLGRHVAIKLLPAETGSDAQAMGRFLREARIVSSLSHPHICTLHDIGEHDGQQFMVMELLDGESLKQRLARGPLAIDDVIDFGVQIAEALDAAHAHGVIHRDIKPANLFVTRRGMVKVLDFGVAKLASSGGERLDLDRTFAASELTTTGSAIGTVAYMSPEQARGREIDARSDLFSFGEVLYEMATGTQAFPGVTSAVIFEGLLTKQPAPPSQVNGNIPAEFDRIVAKALEKDRETRYQSAAELRADLKRLKRETGTGVASSPALPPPPPPEKSRAWWIGAPLATAVVIAAVVAWQSQQTPALTERDSVVLADFRNRTGDAMFDDTLNEALAVQLRQSPFLKLLPEQQVQATLQMMGRDPMAPLPSETAGEVCLRNAGKAVLGGSIASVGSRYLLTLSAQNCQDGAVVAEEAVEAASKDEVLTALGNAAAAFREKLGESLASVQRYDQNIERATTRSLEALKAYSQGMTARRTQGDYESVPFFRRAVELDRDFALAHARLGTVLSNLGRQDEAKAAAKRAYELRDKASERERLYIEARYHTAEGSQQDAIEAYRLLLATYPDDFAAHSNLGSLYRNRGRAEEALHHLEESVRVAPQQPLGHFNLGGAYLDVGRTADARRAWEAVLKLQEHLGSRMALVRLGVLTDDRALVEAHLAAAKTPRGELDVLGTRIDIATHRGQMKEAIRLSRELIPKMSDRGELTRGSEQAFGFAIALASVGLRADAIAIRTRMLELGPLDEGSWDEHLALGALLGDRAIINQYLERTVTRMTARARPEERPKIERGIRMLAAFGRGQHAEAYELSAQSVDDPSERTGMLVGGLSALRLERWDDAVKMFEHHISLGPRLELTSEHALSRIMLARAHAGAGRSGEARAAYEDAFRIWKDADADLPLLVEARKEYQRISA